MIFEDAHWADPTSLELFDQIVNTIPSLRALLIVTFRPEFEPRWIGRPYVAGLTLNRLAEREVGAMIDGVIGNIVLPADIRQDIIERTDGIPLFVEEMTKAVLEAEGEGAAMQIAAAVPSPAVRSPGKPACVTDGTARPAGPRQGNRANRRGDRARVLSCASGCGGTQAGGGIELGA